MSWYPLILGAQPKKKFTPKKVSGLVLWLRADLGITLNGSTVSAWADQSGNGNGVSQATANKQPLYTAADANILNKSVLDFDGSNDILDATLAAALTGMKNWTMIQVAQFDTLTGTRVSVSVGSGNGYDFAVNVGGAGKREIVNKGIAVVSDSAATTSYEIWSATRDNTGSPNEIFKVNGVTQTLDVPASAVNAPGTGLSVGANFTVSFMDGKIAEIIVYNNKISDTDLGKIHTYLSRRYGIALP